MTTTPSQIPEPWWSRYKWWLVVALVAIVIAIIVGAVLVSKASNHKATPTSTPTSTPTPRPRRPTSPTSTAKPTSTPASPSPSSTPTSTPTPTPTPKPTPTPVPTVNGHTLGLIKRPHSRISQIQTAASSGQSSDQFYLNPLKVVKYTLPSYGFTGGFQVVNLRFGSGGSPTPTPTAFPGRNSLPTIKLVVKYQGTNYFVFLAQPAKQGAGGIWLITEIEPQ